MSYTNVYEFKDIWLGQWRRIAEQLICGDDGISHWSCLICEKRLKLPVIWVIEQGMGRLALIAFMKITAALMFDK